MLREAIQSRAVESGRWPEGNANLPENVSVALDETTPDKMLTSTEAEPCYWRVEKGLGEVKARIFPWTENKGERIG